MSGLQPTAPTKSRHDGGVAQNHSGHYNVLVICAQSSGWLASTVYAARTPLKENGVWHRSYPK
eukprot:1832360-Pleurochrysis_carterae.AAC.1